MDWTRPAKASPVRKNGRSLITVSFPRPRNPLGKEHRPNEPVRVLQTKERQAALPCVRGAHLQSMLRRAPYCPDLLPDRLWVPRRRKRLPTETAERALHAGAERVLP